MQELMVNLYSKSHVLLVLLQMDEACSPRIKKKMEWLVDVMVTQSRQQRHWAHVLMFHRNYVYLMSFWTCRKSICFLNCKFSTVPLKCIPASNDLIEISARSLARKKCQNSCAITWHCLCNDMLGKYCRTRDSCQWTGRQEKLLPKLINSGYGDSVDNTA